MRPELLRKGHIEGVWNGNTQSFEPFKSNYVKLFYGKAMIIFGSDYHKGKTRITTKSENLIKDSTVIVVE
ncbi:MAG: hypothetical protein CVU08_08810 [Bacteroidetes bacterium HGW-Bacteroidetes-3]|jgi:hypothetical protein|nr:MAG: hypothetical protein CVU08_08810 [Bacteroidetes bacterium HGW-Bacteroidetes-3]